MASTLLVLFLVFAVAGRVAMQYKITGNHGIRTIKRTSTTMAVISGILLLVSFASIFTFTLLEAIGILEPSFTPNQPISLIGIITSLIGMVLTMVSQYQMGSSWRIGVDEAEKTELVTSGIYSSIRNPIYSGILLFCFGLLLILPDIYMLLSLALVYASIELNVRHVEEPYLLRLHGHAFKGYMNNSGRYLRRLSHGS
jgi:protein-S-isoprenylcysteine O-methyltransferase Ste14